MRIVIDLQGLQSPFSGGRGVGRYTESLVRALLVRNRIVGKHEIFLALNGVFADTVLDIRNRFKALIDQEHFIVWQQFYDPNPVRRPHPAVTLAAKVTREVVLNSLEPDVIFSTNLQEGLFDASITSVKAIASSALYISTLHDVVPYFYPDYLSDGLSGPWYHSKIEDALKSDVILTVSETSRCQIIEETGADPSRVVSIHNGIDADVFNDALAAIEERNDFLKRYGLGEGYLFYFGGCDQHKNLHRLIKAYAIVKQALLDGAPVLVLGGRDAANDAELDALLTKLDLLDHVKRIGFIADIDLPLAIKCARMFVFPSLHEGFGLPALEAMACGVATLGAHGTSVAEIIADENALFDGNDVEDIAARIIAVLKDEKLRSEIGARAAVRATDFSWTGAADHFLALLDTLEKPIRQPEVSTPVDLLYGNLICELPALGHATKAAIAHSLAESLRIDRKPRFFLDMSTVVMQDDRSGIQRVTRAICKELIDNPPEGFDVVPVYSTRIHFGFFEANAYRAKTFGAAGISSDDPVDFQNGDILLYLDLNPGVAITKRDHNRYLRVKGVKIYHVVYDLLPLLRPASFWPELCEEFREWISVVSCSDGAICISRAVADELNGYLSIYGEKRKDNFQIGWFHLGADIDNSAPSLGKPEDAELTLAQVSKLRSFLMVGTVEPRKGHRQTLAAFEALWKSGHDDVGLFIVGRLGWGMHEFAHTLRTHPELGKRLFWLPGISDEYLEEIYERCHCLIAASDGEGFGLPLIEAAQRSKPLIVRDIPVFREVAGGHAYFFDNDPDPAVITEAIEKWLQLFDAGRHPGSSDMPWLKWKDSASQLADVILNEKWVHAVSSEGVVMPGAKLFFDSTQVIWTGFAAKETGFRWTNNTAAQIRFKWNGSDTAHFRMLTGTFGSQNFHISLNGVEHHSGHMDSSEDLIMFNMTGLRNGQNVIDFRLPDARSPSLHDSRRLALSLRHFQIVTPLHFIETDARIEYSDHAVEWYNFAAAEDGFRWSIGHHCHIGFFWAKEPGQFTLELSAVGYGRQQIALSCNGKPVYSGPVEPGTPGNASIIALRCLIPLQTGFNLLAFDLPQAQMPGASDPRLLGIALNHFILSHSKVDTVTVGERGEV